MEEDEGQMATQREIFNIYGPIHLTSIDWNNPYHRTAVTSSLVNGVYTMQGDLKKNRIGHDSLAYFWWEKCGFSLADKWFDRVDGSIYAAVFEHNRCSSHLGTPPRYVIAFRGTMLRGKTWLRDVYLDIHCVFNNLHHNKRLTDSIENIKRMVSDHGNAAVWLAGHSLGAGLALIAGKTMARSGYPLKAYIFNPPTAEILLKVLKSHKLIFPARVVVNVARAAIVKAIGHDKGEEEESFMRLASWIPNLYLNPSDKICSEYVTYFKDRNRICKMGADKLVKLATRFHIKSSEPLHLLPSADLMINTSVSQGCLKAHGICQWWDPTSNVEYVPIRFMT